MCIFCDDDKVIEGLHKNTTALHQLIELQKVYNDDVEYVKRQLKLINVRLTILLKEEHKMSIELTGLEAAVARETAVAASAVTLIQGIAAQLAAAGTDPVALAKLTSDLSASADALAAAVAANTPAAPVVAAAPVAAPAVEAAPVVVAAPATPAA